MNNNLIKKIFIYVIFTSITTMNLIKAESNTNPISPPIIKETKDTLPQDENTQNKILDAEYKCTYSTGSCIVSIYNNNTRRSARCDYSVSPRKAIIDALAGKCEKIK